MDPLQKQRLAHEVEEGHLISWMLTHDLNDALAFLGTERRVGGKSFVEARYSGMGGRYDIYVAPHWVESLALRDFNSYDNRQAWVQRVAHVLACHTECAEV